MLQDNCDHCNFVYTVENHLFDIEAELIDVAHKWKRVGRALRLRPSTLNQIERNQHDVEDCLSAMLEKWLQRSYDVATFGEPSWSLVVRAVSHPAGGGDCALAQKIATKYGGTVSTQLTIVAL